MDDPYVERWSSTLRGDVAVDVGAHEGRYTLSLAKRFRSVLSFEPCREARALLEKASPSNVIVSSNAVSNVARLDRLYSHEGELRSLHNPHPMYGGTARHYEAVEVIRLDDLHWKAIGKVEFLKIDTEGEDVQVLQGAHGLIAKDRPKIQVETHRREDLALVLQELHQMKYGTEIIKAWVLGYP